MGTIPDTPAGRKALKVAELRELLADVGLDTTGTKPFLLERLEQVSGSPFFFLFFWPPPSACRRNTVL